MQSPVAVRRRVVFWGVRTRGALAPQDQKSLPEKPAGRRANRAVGTMVSIRRAAMGLEAGLGPPTARGDERAPRPARVATPMNVAARTGRDIAGVTNVGKGERVLVGCYLL